MTIYSQGCDGDGPCILKDGQPLTPEEIVKELNDKTFSITFLLNSLDTVSSGFGDTKYELENYAEQKLIDYEDLGS